MQLGRVVEDIIITQTESISVFDYLQYSVYPFIIHINWKKGGVFNLEIFYITGIAVGIVVCVLSAILARKNPSKKMYLLPGVILTSISLVIAIATFFTGGDSWSNMGYGILFVFVAIASVLGTAIGKVLGGKTDYRDTSL